MDAITFDGDGLQRVTRFSGGCGDQAYAFFWYFWGYNDLRDYLSRG